MHDDDKSTQSTTAAGSRRERWFVILYQRGPNWIAGKPLIEQPISAHLAYMQQLCKQGAVERAGGFLDEDAGGMVLMRAADLPAAQAIVDNDPAIKDGLFVGVARPFYPMFSAAAGGTPDWESTLRIQGNLQVVRLLFATVAGRADGTDLAERSAAYAAMYDEAVVIHEAPSLPYGGAYEGPVGVTHHAQAFVSAWEDLQSADEKRLGPSFFADGDRVVVLWNQKAHIDGTDERLVMPVVSVYELKDKLIAQSRMYHFDAAATRDFLGRANAPEASATP